MKDLILSPEAEQDLVDIWIYIAEDSPSMLIDTWTSFIKKGCSLLKIQKLVQSEMNS